MRLIFECLRFFLLKAQVLNLSLLHIVVVVVVAIINDELCTYAKFILLNN